MKIDGKEIAKLIIEDLQAQVKRLKQKNIIPHMYIITFGDNPQTQSYLKQKLLKAEQIGAKITIKKFEENVESNTVYNLISKLNTDASVNGIIVQRPLPKTLDEEKISLAVISEKDIDGFHPNSPFDVPVAAAVIKLIKTANPNTNLNSQKIALIGNGITAGKPIRNLFDKLNINTFKIDSKTKNKEEILKSSDIIVSAVGKKIINKNNIKKGVILIGVGMHTENEKLKGDYKESEIEKIASFYTPTPGGVGPVNVAMLMKNLVDATENFR
jgi:methylenetetrahydrofolate dehydrogenase (NADP+) / methenyltetrahydrofolate cyclohydrolase